MRLEAREVVAGYGGNDVLDCVNLRVETGEFVGLIGPNGCGKTTLLRVLSRVLRPRSGAVLLGDEDERHLTPVEIARGIAFVPQQEAAAFEFTVREVVWMGRYPHRGRRGTDGAVDYDCVARAMADADVLYLAERPINTLSGGEHRRVLFARALAQTAPMLLLDEPTAHLDVTHQAELLDVVRRLTGTRRAGAVAALHDLNQAAEYCSRLVLLRAGRVIADGAPDAVLTPASLRNSSRGTSCLSSSVVMIARFWHSAVIKRCLT